MREGLITAFNNLATINSLLFLAMATALCRIVLLAAFTAPVAASSGGLGKRALGKWVEFDKTADEVSDDACGCKDDKNGPVCHPIKLDYIADCAAQAECNGERHDYVACAALRTVSWRNGCSCRHRFVIQIVTSIVISYTTYPAAPFVAPRHDIPRIRVRHLASQGLCA